MSFETTQSVVGCCVRVVGLAGTSVPAWPRLRGTPRGYGGEATKSKTKGGWRHAPCLPQQKPAPKHKLKKTQNKKHKGTKMQKNHRQKTEKTQHKSHFLTAALTTLILITGCQTTVSKQNAAMAHVITQQEILIDTLLAEREQQKVKSQIKKSKPLTTAEAHLAAALNGLKQSNKKLKEVLQNEQHGRHSNR